MKNKGISKVEMFVIILIIVGVIGYLAYYFINGSIEPKLKTMKKSGKSFGRVVSINRLSFHDKNVVYLGEVIESGYMNKIISPFTKNECSLGESKIVFNDEQDNNNYMINIKCDNYLLVGKNPISSKKNVTVYKVSDWQEVELKGDNVEKQTLYNCLDGGKEKYKEYYEELYLVNRINSDYGTEYNNKNDIGNTCPIVEKVFYRTKNLIK